MSASLSPSCPSGGQWFACTTDSLFVGCCTSDNACSANGCAAVNLKPASFNAAAFGQYKDQNCPSAAQWYTCQNADPPFMGCCKSNPCNNGCPQADLAAAILDTMNYAGYVTGSISSSPTTGTATASTTTGSATTTDNSATTTTQGPSVGILGPAFTTGSVSQPSAPTQGLSTGAIAGIAVSGFAGLVLIMGALMFFCRRHARVSRERHSLMSPLSHQPMITEPMEYMYGGGKSPGYSSTHKPSPSPAHLYYDSLNTYPGTPPPLYGQQYAELGGAHLMAPLRSRTAFPDEDQGLGVQIRAPRSRFSFGPSTPGDIRIEREMTTTELPGSLVGENRIPRT